jgi:hypothetical protein
MRPRKSSEPELPDPPLLRELELDRELEELLRELELLDRDPLLNDWPPPGRAMSKVSRGELPVAPLETLGTCSVACAPRVPGNDVAHAIDKAIAVHLGQERGANGHPGGT